MSYEDLYGPTVTESPIDETNKASEIHTPNSLKPQESVSYPVVSYSDRLPLVKSKSSNPLVAVEGDSEVELVGSTNPKKVLTVLQKLGYPFIAIKKFISSRKKASIE